LVALNDQTHGVRSTIGLHRDITLPIGLLERLHVKLGVFLAEGGDLLAICLSLGNLESVGELVHEFLLLEKEREPIS
jgi:hypothetical protein